LSAYIISLMLGYVVGSFPSAYVLVKWKSRLDIRTAGSGNVGTMNTFDVTGSKSLSIAVLLIDLLKGVLAVYLAGLLAGRAPAVEGIAGIGAVLGHNYPVWLKFHGGRGLATAAGVFALLGWVFIPVWCLLFVLTYVPWRDIHTSNVISLIVAPVLVWLAPDPAVVWCVGAGSLGIFRVVALILCLLILIRHWDVLPAVLKTFHSSSSMP
jgi:glycerol-3-phosphate acyltransferase PlsY